MHLARGAVERHATDVYEAAEPPHLLLLQEAPQLGSRFRHVRGPLQFLLAEPEARQERSEAGHGCYDGQAGWPRLEL